MGLVTRVFDKAREGAARGILLVPDWLGRMMMLEVKKTKELKYEGAMRLAMVTMLSKVCGFESLTKSPVVNKVKLAMIKEGNGVKKSWTVVWL